MLTWTRVLDECLKKAVRSLSYWYGESLWLLWTWRAWIKPIGVIFGVSAPSFFGSLSKQRDRRRAWNSNLLDFWRYFKKKSFLSARTWIHLSIAESSRWSIFTLRSKLDPLVIWRRLGRALVLPRLSRFLSGLEVGRSGCIVIRTRRKARYVRVDDPWV